MKRIVSLMCLFAVSLNATAELRLSLAAGERQLDIFRKEHPQQTDDAMFVGLAVGAYRELGERWQAGAVIEGMYAISREQDIGSGRILGFRPVNLVTNAGWLRTEFYGGVAQYDWVKKAGGYYLGLNALAPIASSDFSVGLDYKYFQDLAHDAVGGDHIVDGPALSLSISYKFD